jgi:hypothetical protein
MNMAKQIIFLGWNRAVTGREQHAMKLFEKGMEFFGKLQTDGKIESFEPVLLSAHGGDLNGFVMLRGEAIKLAEVRRDDAYTNFIIEAGYCLEGFGAIVGFVGEGLTDLFARYSKIIGD